MVNTKKFLKKLPLKGRVLVGVLTFTLLLIGCWFLLSKPASVQAEWFDSNWNFRQRIPITYSGDETLTEYQVFLEGIDTATLISETKLQSDCDDLRFVSPAGAILDYYFVPETCNTSDTQIWLKVDIIDASDTEVWMYYGNPTAAAFADEIKTFSYTEPKDTAYVLDVDVNDLQVISLSENNQIIHNSVTLNLDAFSTSNFSSISQWGVIQSKGPYNADDSSDNTDGVVPVSWAGTEFYYFSQATNTAALYMRSPWGTATVTVYDGGSAIAGCTSQSVTSTTLSCNVTAASPMKIVSDIPILVFIEGPGGGDQMPIKPITSQDWIGGAQSTAIMNGSSSLDWRYISDADASANDPSNLAANTADNTSVANDGSYGDGGIRVWSNDSNISYGVMQYADGDGDDSHMFNSVDEQGTIFGSGNDVDYISVASTQATTCRVYDAVDGSLDGTQTLTSSNTDVYFAGFGVGATSPAFLGNAWYMICDAPVTAHYQKVADSESNLQHTVHNRQFTYPTPAMGSIGTEEVGVAPLAFWKLDEGRNNQCSVSDDACDTTENNYDGSFSGNVAWQQDSACISGNCIFLDGDNDYVTLPPNPYRITQETGSMSMWVRSTDIADTEAIFYTIENRDRFIYTQNGTFNATMYDGTLGDYRIVSGGTVTEGWHHLVFNWDITQGELELYVDGVMVDSSSGSSWTTSTNAVGSFLGEGAGGLQSRPATNDFTGYIDEVRVFPQTRSAAQVKEDYLLGAAGMGSDASLGVTDFSYLTDNLLAHWKMNEKTANTCGGSVDNCDSSGNNNGLSWTGTSVTEYGKFGVGSSFDGVNDSSGFSETASIEETSSTDQFTFSAWVKPSSITASTDSHNTIIETEQFALRLEGSDDIEAILIDESGTQRVMKAQGVMNTTNWQHLVFSFDNQTARLFWNGIEVAQTTAFAGLGVGLDQESCATYAIGSDCSASADFYAGLIDEARLFSRALTPAEVNKLYFWAPEAYVHFSLDENTGTANAYDTGTSQYTGTLTGAAENSWLPGVHGSGFTFTDDGDYLTFASGAFDPPHHGTITFWMKNPAHDGTRQRIMGGHDNFEITQETSGTIESNLFVSGSSTETITQPEIDQWYHVAVGYDFSTNKTEIFMNGVKEVDVTDGGADPGTNFTFTVGNRTGSGSGDSYAGSLDEIKFYNYRLDARQVRLDMAGRQESAVGVGGPVVHLTFDEALGDASFDNSGYGNNGDLGNSGVTCPGNAICPARTLNGKKGAALNFDGSNDILDLEYNPYKDIFRSTGAYTVSAWIYPETAPGGANWHWIFAKPYTSNVSPFYQVDLAYEDNDGLIARVWQSGAFDTYLTTGIIENVAPLNQWTHVVMSVDMANRELRLYANGKLIGQDLTASGSYSDYDTDISIGANEFVASSDYYFDGTIDEFKIYPYELSPQEVLTDFNQNAGVVVGSLGTDSSLEPSNAQLNSHCPPGQTSACVGPIAEWRMNENTGTTNTRDSSGNGNTATFNGTMTESDWVPGKSGSGLELDGVDDYLSVADGTQWDAGDEVTYSIWFKSDTPQNARGLMKHDQSGQKLLIYWSGAAPAGTHLEFYVITASGTGLASYNRGTTFADGKWHHVVGVYDRSDSSARVKIYVDGILRDTDVGYDEPVTNGDEGIHIGRHVNNYFAGSLDQARIYNYARTPEQIAWEYSQGAPLAYWKLDECQGETVYDSSLNANGDSREETGTINAGAGSNTSIGTCEGSAGSLRADGATGKVGASLEFDGTDDYVKMSDNYEFAGNVPMSLAAWIKPTAYPAGNTGIVTKYDSGSSGDWYISFDGSGKIRFLRECGSFTTYSTTVLPLSTWTHVVATYDGTTKRIYINGVHDSQEVDSCSITAGSAEIVIGAADDGSGADSFFTGQIDEVKLFNYALTQEQINLELNQGAVRY